MLARFSSRCHFSNKHSLSSLSSVNVAQRWMSVNSDTKHYDYLVIGGGSGGMASARRAAEYGAKVCLVEKDRLGGTCVNVGCVPKKIMYHASDIGDMIKMAKHYGHNVEGHSFDWATIKQARDKFILRLNGIYQRNNENSGVDVLRGDAKFVGSCAVEVGGQRVTADHTLIATGGYPTSPDIPGAEHCITSDGFFSLEQQPRKVAVIGAGYIAVELAGVLNGLGSDVTLLCRKEGVLRNFDDMVSHALNQSLVSSGVNLRPHALVEGVDKDESSGELSVRLRDGETLSGFDCVLFAIGREPATTTLNLAAAGVRTTGLPRGPADHPGFIEVDSLHKTLPVEGGGPVAGGGCTYALGDVAAGAAAGWDLTPVAIAAGRRLADRVFGGVEGATVDYHTIPTVVFSHPPIGTVGVTEAEARAKFGDDDVRVYTSTFVNMFYGVADIDPASKPRTHMKVVCQGAEEKVVGLHIIGMAADEMLQGFGVAVRMGCTKADLDHCIAIHPTAAEELVTLPPWGLKSAPSKL